MMHDTVLHGILGHSFFQRTHPLMTVVQGVTL